MKSASEVLSANSGHKNWIPLLELAAKEVFELMLGSQLATQEAAIESTPEITSMIGLAGQLCGVMSIRCSVPAAARMASKMLGVEPDQGGQQMRDAFGEVCNMVAGNFKNKVSGLGDGCMLSVPTVITGNNYSVHSLTDSAALSVGLLFEDMPIAITLEIHS
jgi:chemotaxis protein CheX